MKKFFVIFVALISIVSFAQNKQTIIIASKFDFQKEKNEYNINNMLKSILVSNNFQVYFEEDILPMEIAQNRCNALTGVLVDKSNVFLTKVKLQIKDCQNNIVFETTEVKSKEKNIQAGFIEAIRLLSPELKKYKPAVIENKVVDENQEIIESPKALEYKTYLNCYLDRSIKESHDFEIIGTSQNVLLFLQKTKNPAIFIAHRENATGVFTRTENKGVFEYYFEGKYMVEEFLF
jgi:hypothetical protein